MKVTIFSKLLILLLLLTIIPLGLLGWIALGNLTIMGADATQQAQEMKTLTVEDSTDALNGLGEQVIRQKAVDVAKQLEIFIKSNPEMTVEDLQANEQFQEIAVQPVGEKGYTAITDVATLICRFHASPPVVNMDLHGLAEKLPGFWGVMSRSEGGNEVSGYYDWAEADGSIKQKYMHIAIVDATTADGVQFSVAATTYIDEFSAPAQETEQKITAEVDSMVAGLEASKQRTQSDTLIFIIAMIVIVIVIGFVFARSISRPIVELTKTGKLIAEGNLETEMPEIKSKDEIKDLSNTMALLIGAIKFLKGEKHKGKK